MSYRKLSHQEVAEIMMDAESLAYHQDLLAKIEAMIRACTTPEREQVWQDCRKGLVAHLESRERRGVPPEGIPYESTEYGRAVQEAIPSLRG